MSQIRALLWVAVSSAPQAHEDKASLPAQEAALTALADAHGWAVVDVLRVPGHSRAYLDIHECAADMRAQGITAFDDLLRHWKARDFDVLACQDGDRFGRSQSLYSYVVERTMQTGARLYMLSNGWVDSANFRMMISMGGYKAASDIDQLVKRRRMGLAKRAERGFLPGRVPWTHKLLRDERGKPAALVVNEHYRRMFEDIYDCVVNLRLPYNRVSLELAARGHRMDDGSLPIPPMTRLMLFSPLTWGHVMYGTAGKGRRATGRWAYGAEPPPAGAVVRWDAAPAVYTGAQAERLIAELERRHTLRGHARPDTVTAFSGLFVCAECGRAMTLARGNGKHRGIPALVCHGRWELTHDGPVCTARNRRSLADLRAWLTRMLKAWTAQGGFTVRADSVPVAQLDALSREAQAAADELDALITQQARAAPAARDAYQRRIDALAEHLHALHARHEHLRAQSADHHARAVTERAALDAIATFGASFWDLPEPVINQHLHWLFGDYRVALPADRNAPWVIVPRPQRVRRKSF